MASITSGIENQGGSSSQFDTEALIGKLLGRGFSQAQTQRALLQAQAPNVSAEYARTQGALNVGRRDVVRPLAINEARAQLMARLGEKDKMIAAYNYESATERAARAGYELKRPGAYKPGQATFVPGDGTPTGGKSGIMYTSGSAKTSPFYTGHGLDFLRGTSYGGWNPAVSKDQELKAQYDQQMRDLAAPAAARAAQIRATLNQTNASIDASNYGSVISAINNPQLLTADVQQIAKILGVKLRAPEGTKLGRG